MWCETPTCCVLDNDPRIIVASTGQYVVLEETGQQRPLLFITARAVDSSISRYGNIRGLDDVFKE